MRRERTVPMTGRPIAPCGQWHMAQGMVVQADADYSPLGANIRTAVPTRLGHVVRAERRAWRWAGRSLWRPQFWLLEIADHVTGGGHRLHSATIRRPRWMQLVAYEHTI